MVTRVRLRHGRARDAGGENSNERRRDTGGAGALSAVRRSEARGEGSRRCALGGVEWGRGAGPSRAERMKLLPRRSGTRAAGTEREVSRGESRVLGHMAPLSTSLDRSNPSAATKLVDCCAASSSLSAPPLSIALPPPGSAPAPSPQCDRTVSPAQGRAHARCATKVAPKRKAAEQCSKARMTISSRSGEVRRTGERRKEGGAVLDPRPTATAAGCCWALRRAAAPPLSAPESERGRPRLSRARRFRRGGQ